MQLVCSAHAHTHLLSGGRWQKDSYSNYIPRERQTGGGIVAVLDWPWAGVQVLKVAAGPVTVTLATYSSRCCAAKVVTFEY